MSYLLSDVIMKSERAKAAAAERPLATMEQVRDAIRLSKNYHLDGSDPGAAGLLLFFQTPRQQTWLVKTPKRLYCILDDVRRPEPHVNWSIPMTDVLGADGRLLLPVRAREGDTSDSGLIDIGPNHKDWLYSRKLFASTGVERAFEDFLVA